MRATFVAAALVTAACHSSAPPAHPTSSQTALSNHPTAPPPRHMSDLALLPADSDAVIGINFTQLQQSPLWQQLVAPRLAALPGLGTFRDLCGFDPLQSLQALAIGMHMGDDPTGTVVVHGYSRKQAMTCFDSKGISQVEKDGTKVVIDGDVVLVTDKSGKQVGFTFVDDTTAIAVIGPDAASKGSIERIASGEVRGLDTSPAFGEMYDKVNTHDSMWMLINAQSPALAKQGLNSMGMHMKAIYGSVNVTDGLALDLRVRVDSPDEATNMVSMAKAAIAGNQQLTQFVDKLDITSEAADIKVGVTVTQQKLMSDIAMFGGLLGGSLGGGAAGGGAANPYGP